LAAEQLQQSLPREVEENSMIAAIGFARIALSRVSLTQEFLGNDEKFIQR
jgi:hypothetical protein